MIGFFDDDQRLRIIDAHDISSIEHDRAIDALTGLAAEICETPICLVIPVEADRQTFIAGTGLAADQTPREFSFCQHAIRHADIMVVRDALQDARFAANALVLGEPGIRSYAGTPLRSRGAPRWARSARSTANRATG